MRLVCKQVVGAMPSVHSGSAAPGRGCLAGPYPSGDGSWMPGIEVLKSRAPGVGQPDVDRLVDRIAG
jgi:hypothetical protein